MRDLAIGDAGGLSLVVANLHPITRRTNPGITALMLAGQFRRRHRRDAR